jgi:peptidase E
MFLSFVVVVCFGVRVGYTLYITKGGVVVADKHIVAGSGGFQYKEYWLRVGPILKYAFSLTGKERPKFCYIGTATGDGRAQITNFYDACSRENVQPSHLQLFPLPNHEDVEQFILSQDVIWVGGGSVANLLAVWRTHGLDAILKKAWEAGIILTGQSAGSICWHMGGTTDSFGLDLRPVTNGLGFLPFASGVHYNSEEQRRPLLQKLIGDGTFNEAYATDDGVAIHFLNTDFHQAVSDTPERYAYHLYRNEDGAVIEDKIDPLYP